MAWTEPVVQALGGEQHVSGPCQYTIYWHGRNNPGELVIDVSQWVPLAGLWTYDGPAPQTLRAALERGIAEQGLELLLPDEVDTLEDCNLRPIILS